MVVQRFPTQHPTVSIVITTYNHSTYLREAVETAQHQSVEPIEVIVVDDGSTDHPELALRDFTGVRLIRQDNQGLAAARNCGWRAASGDFVAFLDADDRLLPDAIEANLARFAAQPDCGFVYGAFRYIDANGAPLHEVALQDAGGDPFEAFLRQNCIGMHATVLYRRDRLEALGGFETAFKACEDYDMYLRMARQFPVASGAGCIAEYRLHGTNMSRDHAMMLAAALTVLGRQREAARVRREWWAAYRQGRAEWRRYYATKHLGAIGRALRRRSLPGSLLIRSAAIARLAPLEIPRVVAGTALQRWRSWRDQRPPGLGDLRRTMPISTAFGYDRGKPVDRSYIEAFLAEHADRIRGRVLEIGDNSYTVRFGGARVERSEVLNRYAGHPQTTYSGDLADGSFLPSGAFDCVILTQTLHLIFDMPNAVATLHRILRPGGVLLVTVPWVSPIDRGEWGGSWYWSVTPLALRRLLEDRFGTGRVTVTSFGNTLAATAFLYGLAEHELRPEELGAHDPSCPVIVAGRAEKPA
jgi:glycosyltransferase involved in cell wall biosynthesis